MIEHTFEFTHKGYAFVADVITSAYHDAPWEDCTPLAEVSDWRALDSKRPSELVLCSDRNCARFYDFAAAVADLRGQGVSGADAAKSARAEFEYFRRWCADQWHYVGIEVRCVEFADDDTRYVDSLWGIESDQPDYHREVAEELADGIIGVLPS